MKLDFGGNPHTIMLNAKVTLRGVSLENINLSMILLNYFFKTVIW